jgi:predicted metal-dependent hydrolase
LLVKKASTGQSYYIKKEYIRLEIIRSKIDYLYHQTLKFSIMQNHIGLNVFISFIGFVIVALYSPLISNAQKKNYICYISDNKNPRADTIIYEKIKPVNATDQITTCFKQIKSIFGLIGDNFSLKTTNDETSTAKCSLDTLGGNIFFEVIIQEKFAKLDLSISENKALVVYILAHELTHYLNGSIFFQQGSVPYYGYLAELLADDRAGFAVAKLNSTTIDFFDKIEFKSILSPELNENSIVTYSSVHPLFRHRVLVAKGGWMEGKTQELKESETIRIGNEVFKVLKREINETQICQKFGNSKTYGITKTVFNLSSIQYYNSTDNKTMIVGIDYDTSMYSRGGIYLGEFDRDIGKPNGIGTYLWQNGGWFNGVFQGGDEIDGSKNCPGIGIYVGTLKNGRPYTGKGIFYLDSETVYQGEWVSSNRTGPGIVYSKNGKIIQQGCWKQDIFVGNICN